MNWKRQKIFLVNGFTIIGCTIFLFWIMWRLVGGGVPITNVQITPEYSLNISRWWDIVTVPIWYLVFIFLFTERKKSDDKNVAHRLKQRLFTASIIGFFIGILSGQNFSFNYYPIPILISALVLFLGCFIGFGLGHGFKPFLTIFLVFLIKFFIGFGLTSSLISFLTVSLLVGQLIGSIVWLRHFAGKS